MKNQTNAGLERDPLTEAVIGAAMCVHTALGPGLDEVFYHEELARCLKERGVEADSRARGTLLHRGLRADDFECDILVQRELVLELKVLAAEDTFAPEHLAQVLCYQKFWKAGRALLFDFGKERLLWRRVVWNERACPLPSVEAVLAQAASDARNNPLTCSLAESLLRVAATHGLGYRDTTYRGLVAADLRADGIGFTDQPTAPIRLAGQLLGEAKCHCLAVADTAAVLVLALRNRISTTDRAILQTYLKHLGLPWGLIANFGKTHFETLFVSSPASSHLRSSPNLRGT
jgi:GxxExxY protein